MDLIPSVLQNVAYISTSVTIFEDININCVSAKAFLLEQVAPLRHRWFGGCSVTAYLMYKLYIILMCKVHVQQTGSVIVVLCTAIE